MAVALPEALRMPDLDESTIFPADGLIRPGWLELIQRVNSLRSALLSLAYEWELVPLKVQMREARLRELDVKLSDCTPEEQADASALIVDLRQKRTDIGLELGSGDCKGARRKYLEAERDAVNSQIHRLEGEFRQRVGEITRQEMEAKREIALAEIRHFKAMRRECEIRGWMIQQALKVAVAQLQGREGSEVHVDRR